jgi:hypothetical protein
MAIYRLTLTIYGRVYGTRREAVGRFATACRFGSIARDGGGLCFRLLPWKTCIGLKISGQPPEALLVAGLETSSRDTPIGMIALVLRTRRVKVESVHPTDMAIRCSIRFGFRHVVLCDQYTSAAHIHHLACAADRKPSP